MLGVGPIVSVGGAVLLARGSRRRRAFMLGAATGILYGVTAAITERTAHLLDFGVLHALTTWVPYTLAVASIVGLLLNQSAFQAGELRWSLPAITVLEPIVAIIIGQGLFAEHIASTAPAVAGQVVGLLAMTLGVIWLAHVFVPETGPPVSPPTRPVSPSSPGAR
jgi:hypothetical protein